MGARPLYPIDFFSLKSIDKKGVETSKIKAICK